MNDKERVINSFRLWTAYTPAFTTWNGALYESELIRAAIAARARNVSKLKIEIFGGVQNPLKTMLKRNPNPLQTWSQFLARASTILDVENNVIIMPWREGNRHLGFLSVPLTRCQFTTIDGTVMLVYFPEDNNNQIAAEFAECGVLTKHQYKSDLFGASNKALTGTMELIHMQNQGIQEAIKQSAIYRFMAQFSELAFSDDIEKERKDFTEKNLTQKDGNDGLLLFPSSYQNIKQLENKQYIIEPEQMLQIRENVFNYFGVNEDVLQNKAFGDAWIAFYEGAIEPFAIQFAEVFERMLFTDLERANGNGVMLASSRLEHVPFLQKAQAVHDDVDRGVLSPNEARFLIWGLEPREGGDTYAIRGEYKNTEALEVNNDNP